MEEKDHHHHVHWGSSSGSGKENNIVILPQRHGHLDVHLGFLQLHHRYHVEFSVPWKFWLLEEGTPRPPGVVVGNPNINCRLIDSVHDTDALRLKVDLLAYKENLFREEMQILCCETGNSLKILLQARVLGKGKGTPLLRNGIRSIGVELSEEDEESDWAGFNSQD